MSSLFLGVVIEQKSNVFCQWRPMETIVYYRWLHFYSEQNLQNLGNLLRKLCTTALSVQLPSPAFDCPNFLASGLLNEHLCSGLPWMPIQARILSCSSGFCLFALDLFLFWKRKIENLLSADFTSVLVSTAILKLGQNQELHCLFNNLAQLQKFILNIFIYFLKDTF